MANNSITLYKQFTDLKEESKQKDDIKEIGLNIINLFDENAYEIIEGFLMNRLFEARENKVSKKGSPISFFISHDGIKKNISDVSLISKIRQILDAKIDKTLEDIKLLDEVNIDKNKIFKTDVLLDVNFNVKKSYYYYFDIMDPNITESYLTIYKKRLIPRLKEIYHKEDIFRQINTDTLITCNPGDFDEANCAEGTSLKNLQRLVFKFVNSVNEGRKILEDDEVVFSHKVDTVQRILTATKEYYGSDKKTEEKKTGKTKLEKGKEEFSKEYENVKKLLTRLLKGTIGHDEFAGFFVKEDYIEFVKQRYPALHKDKISEIFETIVNPRPPLGVTRFIVPEQTSKDGKKIYYIVLEHVPYVFNQLEGRTKNFDSSTILNTKDRHFVIFLKKMLSDFVNLKYSNSKIAQMLKCSEGVVEKMKEVISKM